MIANHIPDAVNIPIGLRHSVPGILALPPRPLGLVLFAHGSGSSRFSRRNRYVADRLFDANLGWLLFDLLTDRESESRDNVFDIPLLAERLQLATEWAAAYPATSDLVPGYFVPVPAPRPRSWPRQGRRASGRWCHAAAVPIWPGNGCGA